MDLREVRPRADDLDIEIARTDAQLFPTDLLRHDRGQMARVLRERFRIAA